MDFPDGHVYKKERHEPVFEIIKKLLAEKKDDGVMRYQVPEKYDPEFLRNFLVQQKFKVEIKGKTCLVISW